MARTLKTRGLVEVQQIRERARRQFAWRRISKADWEYIDKRLDEVEARIISMSETNEHGKEEG
jgi:hypothetical protein